MDKRKETGALIIAFKEPAFKSGEKEKQAASMASCIYDVTAHEKNEAYINHLAAIVECSDDAIISKSLDGTIKSWNRGGEKMFGFTAKEVVGENISLIIPPEYINQEKKILERICNNEIIDHYETMRIKKSGELFYVSITASPLKDATGNIVGVSKIARDITLNKKAERELIQTNKALSFQNEEKEKGAVELVIANKELLFQNEEKEKRAAELVIANKELLFQNEEKEKRAAELVIANKELLFQNEEKEKRAAELVIANKELAFQNEKKEKRAAELVIANKELAFQNNEKEKRAAELIIANKTLVFQNEEKGKRAIELAVANKELEQFAYIASHDLQEPLRTVANYMKVFEEEYEGLLDGNAHKYLHSVNNATNRMSMLIKSLLDFSRLGRNSTLAKVDCKKIINEVMADLETMIKASGAVIEVTEMPELNVYETEMRQVFQNLIINAIKFQEKDTRPEIKISAEKINEEWKFSVSDNGIGIAPEYFERVFNIFQRLHSKEEYKGSGIGLANCKKIIQLHKGDIWVQSKPGQGSTFFFTISNLTV